MNNIYQTQNRPNPYDPRQPNYQTINQPQNYITNQNIPPQFTNQPTLQTTKAKSAYETYQYPQSRQQPLGEITNLQRPNVPVQHHSPVKPRRTPSMAPMTLMNGVSSEELTILLKDANKRLAKKLKTKGCLNQEDVYIGKMKWLLAMVKTQRKLNKHNLNPLGVNIEKIIEESSFALNVNLFQDQNKLRRCQRNLAHFLAKLEPQKAILLSYKLFKMHLKQGNLQDVQTQQEIAQKAYIFFLPYIELIEAKEFSVKEKTQKKRNSLMTYQRIKKFISKPDIVQILQKFPDYKNTPEFKAKFESFLAEKVTLQQAMSVMTLKTQSMVMGDSVMVSDDSVMELPTAPNTQGSLEDLDLVESEMYGRALENARSMDLDEKNDNFGMHLSKLGNYSHSQAPSKLVHDSIKAEQTKLAGTRQSRPEFPQNVIRHRDLSSDAQSNDSSFSDNETDKELMNDPDLYVPNRDRFLSPPRDKMETPFATRTASRFKCEQIQQRTPPMTFQPQPQYQAQPQLQTLTQAQPLQARSRPSFGKQGSGTFGGNNFMTSDDVQLSADPLRVSKMPELIRVNSSNVLSSMERIEQQHEQQQQQQSEHFERKSLARHSIVQKSLVVTKTKQQIIFEKVMSIANDNVSKWDTIVNTPLIKINKIKPEDSPVVLLRAWAVIENFTPKDIFDQIYDTTNRAKWDPVTCGLRVVESIDETSEIIYFYVKTPFGITERDFVQRRNFAFDYPEKGTIIMSFESCTHPSATVLKNRIRAETHIAGYVIKPSTTRPGSTDMCIISQLDIKGSIPKAIVNMVAGKAPADWVNKLKKACERARQGRR